MFFGSCEDENGMFWRLFEGFQKGVESTRRKHVNFINDVNLIIPGLGWYAHLIDQVTDIVNGVIRSRIELKNIEGIILIIFCRHIAGFLIDSFGKDTCTSGLAHPARSRKKECLRQVIIGNGVLQRISDRLLPHDILKCGWAVFACRDYKMIQTKL